LHQTRCEQESPWCQRQCRGRECVCLDSPHHSAVGKKWGVNEEANHALLQGARCRFNASFVDPGGIVDYECREHIDSRKEQCPVSDRKQEVIKRPADASWAIVYFGATDGYRK